MLDRSGMHIYRPVLADIGRQGTSQLQLLSPSSTMSLAPDWVKQLKPAEPHGTDLLTLERGRSSIQADKMALYLFGEEKLRRKNDVENILKNDPVFDKKKNYFDGRVDKFKTALARAKRMRQLAVKYNWDDMDMEIARKLISEPDPYGLHSR
jgi:acyl-CoA oxidase